MDYVKIPNIPEKPVKLVIADFRIDNLSEKTLNSYGIKVLKTKPHKDLYNAISGHPDIMLHHLGDEYFVYAPGIDPDFLQSLKDQGLKLIEGQRPLKYDYPDNIAYNACRVGNCVFHNLKYTDEVLKSELLKRNIKLIDVKQGYTKCSVSVVDENSIITSDSGIAKAAEGMKLDVLLIQPEKAIDLFDLDYGFIGGCTGLIDKDKWAVTGNFDNLNFSKEIREFLRKRSKEAVSLSNSQIIDLGTLIPVSC